MVSTSNTVESSILHSSAEISSYSESLLPIGNPSPKSTCVSCLKQSPKRDKSPLKAFFDSLEVHGKSELECHDSTTGVIKPTRSQKQINYAPVKCEISLTTQVKNVNEQTAMFENDVRLETDDSDRCSPLPKLKSPDRSPLKAFFDSLVIQKKFNENGLSPALSEQETVETVPLRSEHFNPFSRNRRPLKDFFDSLKMKEDAQHKENLTLENGPLKDASFSDQSCSLQIPISPDKRPLRAFFDSLRTHKKNAGKDNLPTSEISVQDVQNIPASFSLANPSSRSKSPLMDFFESLEKQQESADIPTACLLDESPESSFLKPLAEVSQNLLYLDKKNYLSPTRGCKLKRSRPVSHFFPSTNGSIELKDSISKQKAIKQHRKKACFEKIVREPSLPSLPEHKEFHGSYWEDSNLQLFSAAPFSIPDINKNYSFHHGGCNHDPFKHNLVPTLVKAHCVYIGEDAEKENVSLDSSAQLSSPVENKASEPKQIVLDENEETSRSRLIFEMLSEAFYNAFDGTNSSPSMPISLSSDKNATLNTPIVIDCIMKSPVVDALAVNFTDQSTGNEAGEKETTLCINASIHSDIGPPDIQVSSIPNELNTSELLDGSQELEDEVFLDTDVEVERFLSRVPSRPVSIHGMPVVTVQNLSKSKSPTLDMLRSVGFVRESKRRWSNEVKDEFQPFSRSSNRRSWHGPYSQAKTVYPKKSPGLSIPRFRTDKSNASADLNRPPLMRTVAIDRDYQDVKSSSEEQEVGSQPNSSCFYHQFPSADQCCPCKFMFTLLRPFGFHVCGFRA